MSFNSKTPASQNRARRYSQANQNRQFSTPPLPSSVSRSSALNGYPASGPTASGFQPGSTLRSERDYQRHKASLVQCRKCGRSFFPHTIHYHELNCKAGKLSDHGFNTKAFRETILQGQQSRLYRPQQARPSTHPGSFYNSSRPRQ